MDSSALRQISHRADDQPAFELRADSVLRPVQYLGNKLRSLSAIDEVVSSLTVRGDHIADLFSGTSVVSQSFASIGRKVTAVDTSSSCQIIAAALLGISRGTESSGDRLEKQIVDRARDLRLETNWADYIAVERDALQRSDVKSLRVLANELPTIWHPQPGFPPLQGVTESLGQSAVGRVPLFALKLAGTYFGIEQAIHIDSIRWSIETTHQSGAITDWQKSVLLVSLMSAMSTAVHSAGKHFAQPLMTRSSVNGNAFRGSRLLDDRRHDIKALFENSCQLTASYARKGGEGHTVMGIAAEDVVDALPGPPRLVYADPPYTAQQYSRFYHAFETLVNYRLDEVPPITTGLYPSHRYKSAFSSKRAAKPAFEKMIRKCHLLGAHLLISYSSSASGSDGNDRMISLHDLVGLCKSFYGPSAVEISELGHTYRQFNSEKLSNASRNDPELLIVCRS